MLCMFMDSYSLLVCERTQANFVHSALHLVSDKMKWLIWNLSRLFKILYILSHTYQIWFLSIPLVLLAKHLVKFSVNAW